MSQSTESTDLKRSGWHHFLAGEIAGAIAAFSVQPLDTTKTLLQMSNDRSISTFKFMYNTFKKYGITRLYRGVTYPFFGYGILMSIAFGVNGNCQDKIIKYKNINNNKNVSYDPSSLSLFELALCGSVAGFVSSFPRTVIERVKIYSQNTNIGSIKSTIKLVNEYGLFGGLFVGTTATIYREIPQFAVYYPIYEYTLKLLVNIQRKLFNNTDNCLNPQTGEINKKNVNSIFIFLSGSSAGVGCWILTYPIDVIKTRVQAAKPGEYNNFFRCGMLLYKTGGLRIFWNGIAPTLYRASIAHALNFLLYQRVLEFMSH